MLMGFGETHLRQSARNICDFVSLVGIFRPETMDAEGAGYVAELAALEIRGAASGPGSGIC